MEEFSGDPPISLKNILICSDLSPRSDPAIARGLQIAKWAGSAVRVLHTVDEDWPATQVATEAEWAEASLQRTVARLAEPLELHPSLEVWRGLPEEAVLLLADEMDADLVVLGTHRKSLLRQVFEGTTAERVLRQTRRPVLMVRRPGASPYQRALAAVDGSPASMAALQLAVRLNFLGCKSATAVHAVPAQHPESWSSGTFDPGSLDGAAVVALEQALEQAGLQGLDLPIRMVVGGPAEVIEAEVKRLDPDLLVLGTRGQGRLAQLVLGSVASRIAQGADRDVLLVPPQPAALSAA